MSSASVSRRVPTHKLRPKKSRKQSPRPVVYTPIPPMPPISYSSSMSAAAANITKPMRPLTAYHIFFQIEREYIIQTTAGPDADKSIHDKKCYLPDVPRRYRCIKLLPDWYAGPGKRQKRKHRKSHGKIGFLELSQVISKRWKHLDTTDPETKRFVKMVAARELEEYKVEMEHYKHLTEMVSFPELVASSSTVADTSSAMISPSASPRPDYTYSSSSHDVLPTEYDMPIAESADLVLSLDQEFADDDSSSSQEDEIDYSICSVGNNGNYIPSPGSALVHSDASVCDPLFELEDGCNVAQESCMTRCVSPVLSDVNVGVLSDSYLLQQTI